MGFFKRISTIFKTNVNAASDEAEDSDKMSNQITADMQEQLVTTKQQITTHLSQEDSIEKLNLTEYSFNVLTHAGVQTVGELLKLVESGELRAIHGLRSTSILEIEVKLTQVKTLDDSESEANTNTTSDQNDVSLSREASTEEQSLTQHTDLRTVREGGQQVESSEPPTISEVEADTDAIPDQNDMYLSRGDAIEKLNLSRHSFNVLTRIGIRTVGEVLQLFESARLEMIRQAFGRKFTLEIRTKLAQVKILDNPEVEKNTDAILGQDDVSLSREDSIEKSSLTQHSPNQLHTESQTAGEGAQHVESGEIQTSSEGTANTAPDQNDVPLSQEDSTKKIRLTRDALDQLKQTDVRTVGELLQWVESGKPHTTPDLGQKPISEIKGRSAQAKTLDESETEANTTPDQNDVSLSQEDSVEEPSLTEHPANPLIYTDRQAVGEAAQRVESGELPAISEGEVNIDTMLDQNDTYLSRGDTIEKLSLPQRCLNALKDADIWMVGELLKLVELGRLGAIRGLGQKSISEVEERLAQVKIYDNYAHLSLEDPIDWLYLTPRSFNTLMRANIQTIGELLQLVESNGLKIIRGLGQKSILEIKEKLIQAKILNDSNVEANTDAIPWVVVRWQSELVSKQLSRGLLHEEAIIAEKLIKDWLAEIETIESNRVYKVLAVILGSSLNICEEIEFLLNQIPGQYRMTILLSTYGFKPKTLAQTGGELGISRERVRQIGNELKDKVTSINDLKGRAALLRMQSAFLIARDLGLDITYEQWTQRIRSSGLVGDWTSQDFVGADAVEVMIAICNLLADCKIRWLQMPENLQYAVQLATAGKPNVRAKIPHARDTLSDEVKRLINRHTKFSGGVHAKWLSEESERELEEIKDILQGLEYRMLSKDWFAPHQISYGDVFHRCLRQMFQYCGQLGIDDICAGIRHGVSRSGFSEPEYLVSKDIIRSRSVFPVPPPDVMAEILRIDGYQCDDELYYWDGAYDENLSKGETIIMNCLEQIGPVLHHSELVHTFIESDLSFPSLHATLQRSPLFDKIESGLYKLRGGEVTYQDIERAKAAGEPQSLCPEVEYDTNGNIIVSVTLSAIAVGSGTISCERFPDLSGADWECYVGSERAGELNAVENEFRHLKKPFELLNCQPGERLKFTFNTWERTVTIEKEGLDAKG